MGRAQSDTYSSLFTKSDNVNLDETFDRKSALVHVLSFTKQTSKYICKKVCTLLDHSVFAYVQLFYKYAKK